MARPRSKTTAALPRNVYRRGDGFQYRIMVDGRIHCRSGFVTAKDAEKALRRFRVELDDGCVPTDEPGPLTFAALTADYLKWAEQYKRSHETDRVRLAGVLVRFGSMPLTDIIPDRVEAYVRDRRKSVAPATCNREVQLLRRVLNWAVERNLLGRNPMVGVKMMKEPPPRVPTLDDGEEERLLAALEPWCAWVVQVALATACREGEILALRWKHIDFRNRTLTVRVVRDPTSSEERAPKNNESKTIPIHPALYDALGSRRGLPGGLVCPVAGKGDRQTLYRAFKSGARSIGRPELRPHDLRHIAASRLLAAGASLLEVAAFTGHKTLTMAARYSHVNRGRLADLVAAMPLSVK